MIVEQRLQKGIVEGTNAPYWGGRPLLLEDIVSFVEEYPIEKCILQFEDRITSECIVVDCELYQVRDVVKTITEMQNFFYGYITKTSDRYVLGTAMLVKKLDFGRYTAEEILSLENER